VTVYHSYGPGLSKFLGRDHITYCTTVRGPGILRHVIFSGCVTFYQVNTFFVNIFFSLLAKCVLRPAEMAAQVGFVPRVVVWRTLIYTMKRSGDSTHHCRSLTPTLNGYELTPSTRRQSSEYEYSYLTASKRWPSTPHSHKTPKAFHEEPGHILSQGQQNMCV